jgi:pentatricopeptide repeat domain-containing protein 1
MPPLRDSENVLDTEATQFLTKIQDYGNNRMARRAVEVLNSMTKKHQLQPLEPHYTATIQACANSDMYERALEVYEQMKDVDISPTTSTFEALVNVAERTGRYEDTIEHLNALYNHGLHPTTQLYNSCMWACDSAAHPELALMLLERMENEGVSRDMTTYEAAIWACEKSGQGSTADHVLELMKKDGYAPNTIMLRAAMWAHVKGGQQSQALSIFDSMAESEYGVRKDSGCYNAAIWACERTDNYQRSVRLLRLMKMEGFKRSTISYDGALSALSHAGDSKQCLEVVKWMNRESPVVKKSPVTYKVMVDVCVKDNLLEDAMNYYLLANRDGYFVPWVKGTRTLDFRSFSFSLAKMATISILQSMKTQNMDLFTLDIIVGDILPLPGSGAATEEEMDIDFEAEMAFTEGTKFGVLDMDSGSAGVPESKFIEARGASLYKTNCLYVDRYIQWLTDLRPKDIGDDCGDDKTAKMNPEKYAEVDEGTYHVRISRACLASFFDESICPL